MLSIVLPTFNEAENLPALIEDIERALPAIPFEVIIVDDDSPDRTWEVAELLAQNRPYIRVLRRIGRRGLSTAVVEGFAAAAGTVLLAMDSDGQHDPRVLPALYRAVLERGNVAAVGSRYVRGGSTGEWGGVRLIGSRVFTAAARAVLPVRVADPLSGFFAIRTDTLRTIAARLRPTGFKILLEILAALPQNATVAEVPIRFGIRRHGETKLSLRVQWDLAAQLLRLGCARIVGVLFLLALVSGAAFFGARAWRLRLLYLDPGVRAQVRASIERVADENGWLLSDLLMQEVRADAVRVLHRQHHRGRDERACIVVSLHDSTVMPCPS